MQKCLLRISKPASKQVFTKLIVIQAQILHPFYFTDGILKLYIICIKRINWCPFQMRKTFKIIFKDVDYVCVHFSSKHVGLLFLQKYTEAFWGKNLTK